MTKKITIHQPDFLPWAGFFRRWDMADLFIILDDVQFLRRGWHHRDKIKTNAGEKWLTIPIEKKGNYHQQIKDVQIENTSNWRKKHLETIKAGYGKAPEFSRIFPELEKIYFSEDSTLMGFNLKLLKYVSGLLDINTPFKFSSEFGINSKGTERLLELVKKVNGTDYLTGTGSRDYLDESAFSKGDIGVTWDEFDFPVYNQVYDNFIPKLSILDCLMMLKPEKIRSLFIEEI